MMRSGNPTLRNDTFSSIARTDGDTMTIQGTVNKTLLMLVILVATVLYIWDMPVQRIQGWVVPAAIGGFITAMIIIFKKTTAPWLAPVYAVLEGVVIGAISVVFEMRYPGIVMQAAALTFGTLFSLLLAYKSRMIRATENFKLGVVAATGAVFIVYLISFIMSFFGHSISFINGSGVIGIGFSLVVVVIAALNLVLDFDFIENGARVGAPKYMEWYGAFGLIVTLVWLYLEILRLLSKLRER